MSIAVCPGSFDPITNGHLDIIRRASKLFEQVIVLVIINVDKTPTFTDNERVEMAQKAVAGLPNVTVDCFNGLLVDYVRKAGATAIIKGLRMVTDFEYEFQMALVNKKLLPYAETVFLTANNEHQYLSSSVVRQVARFGGDVSGFLPKEIYGQVIARLCPERQGANGLQ